MLDDDHRLRKLAHLCRNQPAEQMPALAHRHGPVAPDWLDVCAWAAQHGSADDRERLLTGSADLTAGLIDWHTPPATLRALAARTVFAALGRASPPHTLPKHPADRLSLRWLGLHAADWATPAGGAVWRPAGGIPSCRVPVLLFDRDLDRGQVGQLQVWLQPEPGAALTLAAAPASAVLPLTPSFRAALDEVTLALRGLVRPDAAVADLALAFDLVPMATDRSLTGVDGPSAGAAAALACAWLLRDHMPDALRLALEDIEPARLLVTPVTAGILRSGALEPIGAVYQKWLSLGGFAPALTMSGVVVHVATGQEVAKPTLEPEAPTLAWPTLAALVHHLAADADPALHELRRARRVVRAAALGGAPQDPAALEADIALVADSAAAVASLDDYALQRWAWWARASGGRLHRRFVPLAVDTPPVGPGQPQRPPAGPFKSLDELLRECRSLGASGYCLRGVPGAGKTTLLRRHEMDLAAALLQAAADRHAGVSAAGTRSGEGPPPEVPLYLPLAGLKHDCTDPATWARQRFGERYPRLYALQALLDPPGAAATSARARPHARLAVLLDGLNELPVPADSTREKRALEVVQTLWRQLQPGVPLLLSTRAAQDYDLDDREGFHVLRVTVQEWTDDDIEAYLQQRFEPAAAARHWQALREHADALRLCRVPMHLDGQCELFEAGSEELLGDRAALYNAWLWQRLRRALARDGGQAVNPELDDPRLLTEADRAQIQRAEGWPHARLHALPWQGALLPSLWAQALAQWRSAARSGVPAAERGQVAVPWEMLAADLPRPPAPPGAPAFEDVWLAAVQALGLAYREGGSFQYIHQSWGEYLASAALLPPTPQHLGAQQLQALRADLAPPPFAGGRSAAQELGHQQRQLAQRWARVPQALWDRLRGKPLDMPWSDFQRALRRLGWSEQDIEERVAFWSQPGIAAMVVDASANRCHANLQAWEDFLRRRSRLGSRLGRWYMHPLAWQALVVDFLLPPFRDRVLQELEAELGEPAAQALVADPGALPLAVANDLDEVAVLAVQGLADPLPWLAWLCRQGLWRLAARSAAALQPRLRGGAGPAAALLQHLRRMLLLRSVASGSARNGLAAVSRWRHWLTLWRRALLRGSARASLQAGGVLAALDAPAPALAGPEAAALKRQWQQARQGAFRGAGVDLRDRLEAGLLLGEMGCGSAGAGWGDNLRYEPWQVHLPGEARARSGLRLKAAHWVAAGSPGAPTPFVLGDTRGNGNERPTRRLTLPGFSIAAYPVTVGEWQGFVASGGYGDAGAPWWALAGQAAQDWLRRQRGAAGRNRVRPRGWGQVRLGNPMQPVMGVTAYEALAYSHWAAALYADWQGQDGLRLQLPTEVLWEAGVRGPAGRPGARQRWPAVSPGLLGGGAPGPLLFNHAATRWQAPSPVGVFSLSNTSHGVADAAGNVWEWCSNRYRPTYQDGEDWAAALAPAPADDGTAPRALRGGGFDGTADLARAGFRDHDLPGLGNDSFGLRLVRA